MKNITYHIVYNRNIIENVPNYISFFLVFKKLLSIDLKRDIYNINNGMAVNQENTPWKAPP